MTLDEYMAGTSKAWIGFREDHMNMLDDAIARIADLTADRDCWMEQCMDARREREAAIADRENWKHRAETAETDLRNIGAALGALARM